MRDDDYFLQILIMNASGLRLLCKVCNKKLIGKDILKCGWTISSYSSHDLRMWFDITKFLLSIFDYLNSIPF